LDCASLF